MFIFLMNLDRFCIDNVPVIYRKIRYLVFELHELLQKLLRREVRSLSSAVHYMAKGILCNMDVTMRNGS
jgi:hypothetical protein